MDPNEGPDVMEQMGSNGTPNVMKPASGSYGDGAAADQLKQQLNLPGSGPGQSATSPTPAPPPGMPQGAQPAQQASPGQVPGLIMRPTERPEVPVATPLNVGAGPGPSQTRAQRNLQMLDALANNPQVSDVTREWAQGVLAKLASRSRG